jgi:hypothetical protein
MKKQKAKQRITWKSIEVATNRIKPTPKNYKLKIKGGAERLTESLEMFGLAGNVVCNTDLTLIDGNSRLKQAKERGEKKLWVSIPSRKLTVKEFEEMSALYDFARAGDVDLERYKGDKGVTADWFLKWNLDVPEHLAHIDDTTDSAELVKGVRATNKAKEAAKVKKEMEVEMQVTLSFSVKDEALFRKLEDKLSKRYKSPSTSQTVLAAFKVLTK